MLLTLAVACLGALLLAPAAQAGKVPGFGILGTTNGTSAGGTAGGQLGQQPRGVAVNTTGAGGVSAGDVYVSDSTNNRISQYSGSGTFLRAFGQDVVVAGGPDNANEVQRVTVKATAGTFRLTFGTTGTKTTGATGTGNTTESSTTVEGVVTSTGAFFQGEAITGPGIPAGTTIAAVGAGTITLSQAATATAAGVALTADLPHNASAALVQSALNALTTISAGGGSVVVSGGPGNETGTSPYVVTFSGAPLKGTDVAQMTSANGFLPLSGGTGTGANEGKVTTSNPGNTGFEICNAGVDTCKVGLASSLAGGIAGGQGLAVDPATGNVFLVSNVSKRVNVYSATGQFQGAFGWNVNVAAPEAKLQFCTFATGCQAGSTGGGAGQFGTMTGEAQAGSSPAVSPLNGHLFVPQPGNRRMDEFSFTLAGNEVTGVAFVKAFGGDVVPTIFEKQTVTLTGATGGTFALSFAGKSTDAGGSGDVEAGSNEVTNFKATDGSFVLGEEVSGPGIPAGTRITAVTFDSLTLTNAATATSTGATLAAGLPFDAGASVLQSALAALSSIGTGNVAVSGANGGPYAVEFKGSLAGTDVAEMTADAAKLTGTTPSVGVVTTQTGANGAGTGFETCTVATTCKPGLAEEGGEFNGEIGTFPPSTPTSVAIDSTGSIYVTGPTQACQGGCRVQKFDATVSTVEEFAPAQLTLPAQGDGLSSGPRLVSIDPANDHVLVVKRVGPTTFKIFEFTRTGSFIDSSPPSEAGLPSASNPTALTGPQGFAVGTADRAYYATQGAAGFPAVGKILGVPPVPKATVEAPTGVSETTATFVGVAQPSAPGIEGGFATAAFFEYSTDGVSWTATDATEIGTGTGAGNPNTCPTGNPPSCNVSRVVGGLKAGTTYLVRMVVSNGTKATSATANFTTPDSAPGITGLAASDITQTAATLNGEIEPNGEATSYHFEWGPTTSYGTRVPADFEAVAGTGSQPIPVSIQISGLQPATTYHYRIVAKSISGTTTSADQELTTLNASGLPSNRGIELISPADKNPVGGARPMGFSYETIFRAADDGDGISYPILNGLDDSTAGGELIYAASRSESGWTSKQVTPPSMGPAPLPSNLGGRAGTVRAFSPDLRCAAVESHNPLSADTPQVDVENNVQNLYLWDAADGSYTLLTNQPPLNPTADDAIGANWFYGVAGITPDCSKVFFRSLTYAYLPGASGVYEWDSGTLRDAGLRPDQSTLPGAVGTTIAEDRYTVSDDGRLFFEATSNETADNGKKAVFVRKGPDPGEVVNASKPIPTGGPTNGAMYQAASPDGSHVFFLANYGIAATSSPSPTTENCSNVKTFGAVACDLYDYDVEAGTLTDISADTNPADPRGAVVQGVLDVSEDGETVYFAARGQLVPGEGRTYAQNQLGEGFANIYRYHDGELSYVGGIDGLTLTGVGLIRNPGNWSAQTTKSGEYLLFQSMVNALRQVYLYSAEAGTTECLSCPKGAAPEGTAKVPDQYESAGYAGPYTPRSLSEDGRAFFSSQAPLTPGAIQGMSTGYLFAATTNVYEWYRGQLSLLAAGRVELTDTGGDDARDVYIQSFEQMVPQDIDFAADIYDLRIGSPGFAEPPAVIRCDPAADQCQGTPTAPPSAPTPPSAGFTGPGSSTPEKAKPKKCPKGKVLKHGKCVRKPVKKKQKAKTQSKRAADNNRGGAK